MNPYRTPPLRCHAKGGNEMVTTPLVGNTKHFICKQLDKLPPVVNDWQQCCQQPRCSHYCDGKCYNPGRTSASAPCPFDGKELLLVDAKYVDFDNDTLDART